eukprot:gene12731-biopygen16956
MKDSRTALPTGGPSPAQRSCPLCSVLLHTGVPRLVEVPEHLPCKVSSGLKWIKVPRQGLALPGLGAEGCPEVNRAERSAQRWLANPLGGEIGGRGRNGGAEGAVHSQKYGEIWGGWEQLRRRRRLRSLPPAGTADATPPLPAFRFFFCFAVWEHGQLRRALSRIHGGSKPSGQLGGTKAEVDRTRAAQQNSENRTRTG